MLPTKIKPYKFGFSLIEVMIALIILSVGTLGLTGMILTSNKLQPHEHDRVTKSNFVHRLEERIRNNGMVSFASKDNQTICEAITGYSHGEGETGLNCQDTNNANQAGKGYVTLNDGSPDGLFVWLVFNICPNSGTPGTLTDNQSICGEAGQYSSSFNPASALPFEVACTANEVADPAMAKTLRMLVCSRKGDGDCACEAFKTHLTNPAA